LNGAITLTHLYNIPLVSQPLSTGNTTQFSNAFNDTAIVDSWEQGSGGNLYGDVTAQVRFYSNLFRTIVWGFSDVLLALGISQGLVTVINMIWVAYFVMYLLWMIGGRDAEG